MEESKPMRVAVLIDAENISQKYVKQILDEASRIGAVICKRIYGDWSSPSLMSWKNPIMDYSIQAVQQFHCSFGKNSSDSALIIDAMDLLHEEKYQCICIVSSDSDFTRLASRLRESEIYVVGMGEKKTPASFRSACNKFLYLDVLTQENLQTMDTSIDNNVQKTDPSTLDEGTQQEQNVRDGGLNKQLIVDAINDIIAQDSDEDGWCFLANLGNQLLSRFPDFDVRNFGFAKLTPFVESFDLYQVKSTQNAVNPSLKLVYIRKKQIDFLKE